MSPESRLKNIVVSPELRLKKIYGDKAEKSATSIQSLMRGTLQRRHLELRVNLTHKAAVCVQSRIRQFLARKRVDSMRADIVGDEDDLDDDCDDFDVDTSREEMLAIFDSKEENEEEEENGVSSDEPDTKREKKKKTAKKKKGTTYSRGTFFGTYRRSKGGTLHLTNMSGRQDSIEEEEKELDE